MLARWEPFGSIRRQGRDVLGDLTSMQQEMNRLFSGTSGEVHEFPAVNVWTGEEDAVVTAELPGVDPETLDISIVGSTLTLRGTRLPERLKESDTYLRRERMSGEFVRGVELPFRVDSQNATARFCKGVLQVTMSRAVEDRPRKIEIKAA